VNTNFRCESTVSHRDGFFDDDYPAREFTAKIHKTDICPASQLERFGEDEAYIRATGRKGARMPFRGRVWH
jgi:hypothetical protein